MIAIAKIIKVLKNLIKSYEKYFSKNDKKTQKTGEFLVAKFFSGSPKFWKVCEKLLLNSSEILK